MQAAITYKTKIASRYIPVDPEQIGLKVSEADYYLTSIKYNGHFAILQIEKGKVKIFTGSGSELKIPSIQKAAESLKKDMILAGELVVYKDDQPTTHMEVTAALDEPDKHDIRLAVFDLLEISGKPAHADLKRRFEELKKLLSDSIIFPVSQMETDTRKDIISFYKENVPQQEGIVVRASNGIIYKVKPTITLDLVVLGYAEDPNAEDPRLRELLLGFVTDDGQYQIASRCGNGFSEAERKEWITKLQKIQTATDYTEVSGAKTAFIMVQPQYVVEITCLDMINQTTTGPVRKALLSFDDKKGYASLGNRTTISCISPVYTRVRDDKKANQQDTGELQAYHLTPRLAEDIIETNLAESKTIIREVFKKEGKNGIAVRKFIALQTNKEQSGLYAPFVVIYTDYSAGRKTPLEQELYLCEDKTSASAKINDLKEENIKKGWELHS
jgi:ATP-dependent DNA ligase